MSSAPAGEVDDSPRPSELHLPGLSDLIGKAAPDDECRPTVGAACSSSNLLSRQAAVGASASIDLSR